MDEKLLREILKELRAIRVLLEDRETRQASDNPYANIVGRESKLHSVMLRGGR